MRNCVITLSKWLWQASGSAVNFDNVMANLSSIRGQTPKKLTSICFFTITRPQSGQMPGINVEKRRRKLAVNKAM